MGAQITKESQDSRKNANAQWRTMNMKKPKKQNDPRYLRLLLRECLDFWASPEVVDMPPIDLFDEISRASYWKPLKERPCKIINTGRAALISEEEMSKH